MELNRPQEGTVMPGVQCSLRAPCPAVEVAEILILPSKSFLKTGSLISDLVKVYDLNKQQKNHLLWKPSL